MGNIAVIGASGAIGRAFCNAYADRPDIGRIYAFSRSGTAPDNPRIAHGMLDLRNEASIAKAALAASADGPLSHVIVASGLLHDSALLPEKSLKSLSAEKFMRLFEVNAIGPALIAKHFIPKMDRAAPALFAALSARVGSISDNFLGGWHAYRASKAALNMIIKCVAIEYGRSAPNAIVIGLHPGTVKSALSAPFERGVAPERLFLPEEAVAALIETMNGLTPRHSGKCFAYNGEEIAP